MTPTRGRGHTAASLPLPGHPWALRARPPRTLRASVAASLAVGCGLTGHVLAGGAVSAPAAIATLLAAVAVTAAFAGRERGWLWLAGQQVGTQLVVHAAASGLAAPDGAALLPHDLMFALHVVAGLLAATLLRPAERRLWAGVGRVAAAVARCLERLAGPGSTASAPAAIPAVRPAFRAHQRSGRGCAALRGPPLPA
ncbi:hypothetical protein [Pseudonocardia sp.]|uniref:hypothetical protein n=1 Tax=Pseudonocardia sp. TaxID=60912 RepID=UPI003D0FFFB5